MLPSEQQLWRAPRNGLEPGPIEIAGRVMRVLKRYERSWPNGQELLQLGRAIAELGFLLLKRNNPLNDEQVFWGWKRIEKVALQISSFSISIDLNLSAWAEDLVYSSARHAASALIRPPVTHYCTFCWRTGYRRIRGLMYCKEHLAGSTGGRRMRYLAKKLGDGNLKLGVIEFQSALVTHQHRIFRENKNEISLFTLEQARHLDPVMNPWWKIGVGIRQEIGPGLLYVRYKATNELLVELRKRGEVIKLIAAKNGGRRKGWTETELHDAIGMKMSGKTLREIRILTGVPQSSLSRKWKLQVT